MPTAIQWTPAQDAQLSDLRGSGLSWAAIGNRLDVCRNSALARGRRIGAVPAPRPVRAHVTHAEDAARLPLPAGHATSWEVITEGTLLEGVPYPAWQPLPCGRERRSGVNDGLSN